MELTYILRAIRRYWWIVLIGANFGLFSGYLFDSSGGSEYQATSILLLSPGSATGSERFVQNEFVILGSGTVADQAASRLDNVSAAQISESITLQRIADSDLVRITATGPSAAWAQDVANAYADAYLTLAEADLASGRQPEISNLNGAINDIEDRLAVVDRNITEAMAPFLENANVVPEIEQVVPALATERAVLLGQYSQLLTTRNEIELAGEERLGSRVSEYATRATVASGPGSKLVVVVGLTAGALIGALAAVVVSRLSGLVVDANDAAATLRAPVVATVPKVSSLAQHPIRPGDPLPPALAPAVQALAVRAETSVPSTEATRRALVVLVAGAERGSGATTLAVALACYFADKDHEVLLVDADVLHPQLSDSLGDGASGVRALLGEATAAGSRYVNTAAAGVRFAGLDETLRKRSLRRQDVAILLDNAAHHAHVVVIDGGTLMATASSVELAQRADAVVLTMPARRQTRAALEGVARVLAGRVGGLLPVVTAARRLRHGAARRATTVVDDTGAYDADVDETVDEWADDDAAPARDRVYDVLAEEASAADVAEEVVTDDAVADEAAGYDVVRDDPATPARTPGPPPNRGRARARRSASAASRRGSSRGT